MKNKTAELAGGMEFNMHENLTSSYYWVYKQITEQLALWAECHREAKAHLKID